jgi:hypothetical protein
MRGMPKLLFMLWLLANAVFIAAAVGFWVGRRVARRKMLVQRNERSDRVATENPIALVPFDDLQSRLIPELKKYLANRVTIASDMLLTNQKLLCQPADTLEFEHLHTACDMAKAFTEVADEDVQEAFDTLINSLERAFNSQQLDVSGFALRAATLLAAASLFAIIGTSAAFMASLKRGDEAARENGRLDYLLEITRLRELSSFETAYSIARQQILCRRTETYEFGRCRFEISQAKTISYHRFRYEIGHLPDPLNAWPKSIIRVSSPKRIRVFEDAVIAAARSLNVAFLASCVDFCVCDAINEPSMFGYAIQDDVRHLGSACDQLAAKLTEYRGIIAMPRADQVLSWIEDRHRTLQRLSEVVGRVASSPVKPDSGEPVKSFDRAA